MRRPGAVIRLAENCFIRDAPSAAGAVLGVERRGSELPFGGAVSPEGWLLVLYRGAPGWVSGRGHRIGERERDYISTSIQMSSYR